MKFSLVLIVAWGLTLASSLVASTNQTARFQYSSRNWQISDGLPNNAVSAVRQARDGYLWIGTAQGLARFDGTRFTSFPSNEIKSIRFISESTAGFLSIGTDRGDLFLWKDGTFSQQDETGVRVFCESRDNSQWLGTTNGVVRLKGGQQSHFTKTNGLSHDTITAICEDQEGTIWIGTSRGLCFFKENDVAPRTSEEVPSAVIRSLFCDRENTLWIGTSGDGLLRLKGNTLASFSKTDGLPDVFINTIMEDSRGELWIGTLGGLCRWTGESFVQELNDEGLSYETVFSMTEDSEGNLWLGTKEGLTRMQVQHFRSHSKQNGLSHNNVMSVLEDSRGTVWAATWGGGLNGLRKQESEGGKQNSEDGQEESKSNPNPALIPDSRLLTPVLYNRANSDLFDLLLSIHETREGSLWLGVDYDGGLFRFKEGTFTRYRQEEGLIDPAVRVIKEDRQGNLWIGTSGALYRMRDEKLQRFTTTDGLAGNIIRAIHEDREGNLWIGSNEGLSVIKNEKLKMTEPRWDIQVRVPGDQVLSIHEDAEKDLWFGTGAAGLHRIKNDPPDRNVAAQFTTKDGLFSNTIFEILEDDAGYLWMSCLSGVFRVSKKDLDAFDQGKIQSLHCAVFGTADGMSSAQCNGVSKPGAWKGKDGRLWFPTTRGVAVVDPRSILENSNPPPVVIEEVISDKSRVLSLESKVGRAALTQASGLKTQDLVVKPGRGELEFRYTALSFKAPERNRFKYKLEGVDSDWVDAGERRIAYYNNISPGSYRFHVIGCNNEGAWNNVGAIVAVNLLPHFWQTKWFLGLMALAGIGVVAGTVRYITWRNVQEWLRRIEQQHALEKERSRIARDMHDDLGAHLTEILLLSNLTRKNKNSAEEVEVHATKITSVAQGVIDSLHAIVWAVNPKNDSLDKLILFICDHAQAFLKLSGVRCRFDLPLEQPPHPLASEVRHNVFLVVKEALNNIARHAQASEAWIRFRYDKNTFSLSIEDDGKGFAPPAAMDSGNGLQNMEKRMKSIGGQFELTSEPGKGTRITLRIPLQLVSQ